MVHKKTSQQGKRSNTALKSNAKRQKITQKGPFLCCFSHFALFPFCIVEVISRVILQLTWQSFCVVFLDLCLKLRCLGMFCVIWPSLAILRGVCVVFGPPFCVVQWSVALLKLKTTNFSRKPRERSFCMFFFFVTIHFKMTIKWPWSWSLIWIPSTIPWFKTPWGVKISLPGEFHGVVAWITPQGV